MEADTVDNRIIKPRKNVLIIIWILGIKDELSTKNLLPNKQYSKRPAAWVS